MDNFNPSEDWLFGNSKDWELDYSATNKNIHEATGDLSGSVDQSPYDYTSQFTTSQIFETRDEMREWVQTTAIKNGFIVVITMSASRTETRKPRCVFGCERGGKYDSRRSEEKPLVFRDYVSHILDVKGDGNCGFRAIAELIYGDEERWRDVRVELMNEIQNHSDLYDAVYSGYDVTATVFNRLNSMESPVGPEYWMEATTLGVVIASTYNVVLHTFTDNLNTCLTHVPLRYTPSVGDYKEIAICLVNNNHFVELYLHPNHPVPPITSWCTRYAFNGPTEWQNMYANRIEQWNNLRTHQARTVFGGVID